ncbi:tyrosine-protein kinase family protein [Halomonas sp. AOP13-D3-9]
MSASKVVRFDESLPLAVRLIRELAPAVGEGNVRFVRDIEGYLHVVIKHESEKLIVDRIAEKITQELGSFAAKPYTVVACEDTLAGNYLFEQPSIVHWVEGFRAHVIERRAMGVDWVQQPTLEDSKHPPRFVFFSLKGGVGRSTALALWARELCRQGKTVLVIDMDLEAPGLGAQLLEQPEKPAYGVADWLVNDLVSENTGEIIRDMARQSPIANAGLWVVPAFGKKADDHPQNVISKLARAYLEKEVGVQPQGFAHRLKEMIALLEAEYNADVVLIDSRAGLHETVAVSLLHLSAEVLCFAVDLKVTWQGYQYLFSHLAQLAQSQPADSEIEWRERFKMINARSTLTQKESFVENSYALWVDTLYDSEESSPEKKLEVEDDDEIEGFSFDIKDESAPHYPVTILRSDLFENFDPQLDVEKVGESQLQEVFGELFSFLNERMGGVDERR